MAQNNFEIYNCKMPLIMENNRHLFDNHKGYIPEIEYIEGSFFEKEWTNPSMVFSNSTCFSKDIMDNIFERANELPRGTFFINTSQRMSKKILDKWNYLTPFQRVMSWGTARIFIYRKK
jgi:hypothetical protein